MSDDRRVTASDERAAVQDALGAHLGREIRVREIFAIESQLYTGYLIIVGGTCYFLCARYGDWGVHSEFATSGVTSIEVIPSFSTDDLFEVRVLVRGRLHRFSGVDEGAARALARVLEVAGGEAAEIRPARQAPPVRKRLSFSDSLSARPSYEVGAAMQAGESSPTASVISARPSYEVGVATQAASPSRGLSSPPPLPPPLPPPSSSAGPQASAMAFPPRTVSRSFSAVMADVHDDDDDDDDDDFDRVEDDSDDDDDDSEEFEKLLAEMDRKVVAGDSKTSPAPVKPKVRPFVRGGIAVFLFPVIHSLAEQSPIMEFTWMPEFAPFVHAMVLWCSVAISGGLVSLSFGRTVAMLIAGPLAAMAVVNLVPLVGSIGSLAGWFVISWVYIISRSGSSAFLKAALITGGMAMFLEMGVSQGATMVLVGVFWLIHAYLELVELNAAAKKSTQEARGA